MNFYAFLRSIPRESKPKDSAKEQETISLRTLPDRRWQLVFSPQSRWVRYGTGVIAFAGLSGAWYLVTGKSGGITPASERRVMPALVMRQLDGGSWRMTEHRGQVVLVNYWASWCGPCWEETPGLIRLSKELGPRGLAVVGVAVDEGGTEKVEKFIEEFRVPYPVALPEAGSQLAYGMAGVPTTILVDKMGRVAKTYAGAVRQGDFEKDVQELLGEGSTKTLPSIRR